MISSATAPRLRVLVADDHPLYREGVVRSIENTNRELARMGIITASSLIAFEKGRTWPRERTRATLEELAHWPAGTLATIRAGGPIPGWVPVEDPVAGGDDEQRATCRSNPRRCSRFR